LPSIVTVAVVFIRCTQYGTAYETFWQSDSRRSKMILGGLSRCVSNVLSRIIASDNGGEWDVLKTLSTTFSIY